MMECLCELIYTTLESVAHEHGSDVVGYAVQSVCEILEEFDVGCVPGRFWTSFCCVSRRVRYCWCTQKYWVVEHH